jgi:hypothetical protein
MLPRRKPIPAKRDTRWRSPAHTGWLVKTFGCCMCGSTTNTVAAHVRLGSHTGLGQKPDDWRCVPLCDGISSAAGGMLGCHNRQHAIGEATFWTQYEAENGQTVEQLLASLCSASPKAERGL